jgi:uncharacterized protein
LVSVTPLWHAGRENKRSTHRMLVDSFIVPQCTYRPGSFTGLMTLYESNYLKLAQLGGFKFEREISLVSSVEGDCDLHLVVSRCEPYTTTLKLTYWFNDAGAATIADPDLTVRAYHDARLVEVLALADAHRHHKLQELALSHASVELDRRWQRNMTLNKWLDYLLDLGHGFDDPEA